MTRNPPSETSAQDAGSRRDRLVARRGRRTQIIVAAIVVVIAGAVAVAAYALNAQDPRAQAAGPKIPKPTRFGADGTLVPPRVAKAPATRSLDHTHPLRLWIGGDSLAGSFGPALGDRVGATGVVQTLIDYRVSSGLWSNDVRNWYQRATDQMASDRPDAVVFMIGTNDAPVVNQVDSNGDGVPDWQTQYRVKVARMMDLLVGSSHRTLFWLGPPTVGTRSMDRGAAAIGQVMREEAAKRAPDVVYLDTYKLFSTKDGTYSRRILDENGQEIVARISDGVHFTADGAQYLARAVFSLIDARWRLSKQADLTQPIGWSLAPGSGEAVPGFSSRPRSRYRPQTGSTATTSPPASPTTAAPPSSAVPTTVAATTRPSTVPVATTAPKPTVPNTTPTTTKQP
ncbi:MAG: DUF459 domain-containing protein [Actinomycetota bacterium]|nr:DUF459 domain-containing protein [Actinomycetota bacterium]